mgnify:CR=1 FL=1
MMILTNYSYESKSPSKAIFLILARVACSDFRAVGRSENLGGNQYIMIKGFLIELVLRPNRPKSDGVNAPSPSRLYVPSLSSVLHSRTLGNEFPWHHLEKQSKSGDCYGLLLRLRTQFPRGLWLAASLYTSLSSLYP